MRTTFLFDSDVTVWLNLPKLFKLALWVHLVPKQARAFKIKKYSKQFVDSFEIVCFFQFWFVSIGFTFVNFNRRAQTMQQFFEAMKLQYGEDSVRILTPDEVQQIMNHRSGDTRPVRTDPNNQRN